MSKETHVRDQCPGDQSPGVYLGMREDLVVTLVAVLAAGCYTTHIQSGRAPSSAPVQKEHQWFTVAGLVPLSGVPGEECPNGLSWAKSEQSFGDILFGASLLLAGTFAASQICDLPDRPTGEELSSYNVCTIGIAGLLPFLLGVRTIKYQCAAGNSAPGVQVPSLAMVPGARR